MRYWTTLQFPLRCKRIFDSWLNSSIACCVTVKRIASSNFPIQSGGTAILSCCVGTWCYWIESLLAHRLHRNPQQEKVKTKSTVITQTDCDRKCDAAKLLISSRPVLIPTTISATTYSNPTERCWCRTKNTSPKYKSAEKKPFSEIKIPGLNLGPQLTLGKGVLKKGTKHYEKKKTSSTMLSDDFYFLFGNGLLKMKFKPFLSNEM